MIPAIFNTHRMLHVWIHLISGLTTTDLHTKSSHGTQNTLTELEKYKQFRFMKVKEEHLIEPQKGKVV